MRLLIALFLTILIITACSKWGKDEDKFVDTYRQIVFTRMMYPDTSIANPKVDSILNSFGFTKESFKQEFFRFAKDGEKFNAMLDSARMRAAREYEKLQNKTKKEIKTIKKSGK